MADQKKKRGRPPGKAADSGKHKTARRMVGMPQAWFDVAHALAIAGEKPTPTLWWILTIIREKAVAAGIKDLPPMPWESDDA